MVALNSDFAASKPNADTKNRVGRFFSLADWSAVFVAVNEYEQSVLNPDSTKM